MNYKRIKGYFFVYGNGFMSYNEIETNRKGKM